MIFRPSDRSSNLIVHRSSSTLKKPTFDYASRLVSEFQLFYIFSFFSVFMTLNPPKNIQNLTQVSVFLLFGPRPSFFRLLTSFWSLFERFWGHFGRPLGEPRTRFWLFFLTWAAKGSPGTPQMVPNGPMDSKSHNFGLQNDPPGLQNRSPNDPQTSKSSKNNTLSQIPKTSKQISKTANGRACVQPQLTNRTGCFKRVFRSQGLCSTLVNNYTRTQTQLYTNSTGHGGGDCPQGNWILSK